MTGYTILSIAYVQRPSPGRVPLSTLLVGAAVLDVADTPNGWTFDLDASTALAGDDADAMLRWIAGRAWRPDPLLLWRAGDIVVPALIEATKSSSNSSLAVDTLRALEWLLTGTVVDVAELFGGAGAISFDAIAHELRVPFEAMSKADLEDAWRAADHDRVRGHLATRAAGTFALWLKHQDQPQLIAAFDAWLQQRHGETR